MTLHMHFGAPDLLRCRFAISPLWETHHAIRTLIRSEGHGYHPQWVRRAREAVVGLDLEPMLLMMPWRGYTPDFLCPPPAGPLTTLEGELARVRATDPAAAHPELSRALAQTAGSADHPLGRRMLADPAWAIGELADLYERAWDALLAPYWPRLRSLLEADIAFRTRRLADDGLAGLFADLHPRISWADETLTVTGRNGSATHSRVLDGDGLVLVPGVFVWPAVVGGFDPPWQPTLIYPARGIGGLWSEPAQEPSQGLSRLIGANRAEILVGLDTPATTSALADRHGLALSSVSAHLSVLRDAGLLLSRRHGHQVRYERTPLGDALAR
ncbi:DUF5937 family protein [Streptomyces sp. SID3343]|uniref:ArsR/SmtB family transcription factor n=1 Tax=Streptomyces sp. SID3343 TaxID=2690260 RepID=UPI00136F5A2C|nr:DUF5937 family protein [Streptomyces sp. SID3343]MYW04309.1 helix-turn-helix domain-containing protein [Streptomyces sp. SID3343]